MKVAPKLWKARVQLLCGTSSGSKSKQASPTPDGLRPRPRPGPSLRAAATSSLPSRVDPWTTRFNTLFATKPEDMTDADVDRQVEGLLGLLESTDPSLSENSVSRLMSRAGPYATRLRKADDAGRAPPLLRRHAVALLRLYEKQLIRLKNADRQPTFPEWDNLVLPLLLECQNARSGVQCELVTEDELSARIARDAPRVTDAVFIVDKGKHRSAAHLSTDPSRAPRLAIVDSFASQHDMAERVLASAGIAGAVAAPVYLETQRATECSIFALDTAKRIATHRGAIESLYPALEDGRPAAGVRPLSGGDDLPFQFFKHAQTVTPYERLAQARPEIRGTPINRQMPAVDIYERWELNRVTRVDEGVTAVYSASIEAKRLKLIARAIAYYEADADADARA